MKEFVLTILVMLVILSCRDSNNKNMNVQENKNKEAKQDSVSGYAPVNGLKMYYEIH
jgi:hypothetical protein